MSLQKRLVHIELFPREPASAKTMIYSVPAEELKIQPGWGMSLDENRRSHNPLFRN